MGKKITELEKYKILKTNIVFPYPEYCIKCGEITKSTWKINIKYNVIRNKNIIPHIPCCEQCQKPLKKGKLQVVFCILLGLISMPFIPLVADYAGSLASSILGFISFMLFFGSIVPYVLSKEKNFPFFIVSKADNIEYYFGNKVNFKWFDDINKKA